MLKKKIVSLLSVAAVTASLVLGTAGASVSAEKDMVVPNSYPQGTTLSTFLKDDYRGYESVEINYEYESETMPDNAGDTFAFLVFDANWGGWDKINVGQNNPISDQTYSQTVPISTIESALSTGNAVYGFNLITDNFGDGEVIVNSVKLIDKAGQEAVISGEWTKGTASAMDVTGDLDIVVDANAYNIYLNGFSAYGFTNPAVKVTVNYDGSAVGAYKEATLYYVDNYNTDDEVWTGVEDEQKRYKEVKQSGEVTYTFQIDETRHSLFACFDDCTVTKIEICDAVPDGFSITGNWTKGSEAEMSSDSSDVWWYAGSDNIYVFNFSLEKYLNPTVEIIAEYTSIPEDGRYLQAELYSNEEKIAGDYVPITQTGEVVYTFDISSALTSFNVCFDGCTVTSVRVYDNRSEVPETIIGKSASQLSSMMGKGWNLGNALDCTTNGTVGETLWNNKIPVSKELFDAVKEQGFGTVRIPVSYMDKIVENEDGTYAIDDTYMTRVKQVVDSALDAGLFVIIDIHHDGSDGVTGNWIDISGNDFATVKAKFSSVWSQIASEFSGDKYDQHLLFESMNEVKVSGQDTATATAYGNLNALNQAFVNAVRSTGGKNTDRVLIVPGYNTDIDQTVSGMFVKPTDTSEDRLMLSVHYYDPYEFTIGTSIDDDSWGTNTEKSNMVNQLTKVLTFANAINMPIVISEYGANDKENTLARSEYLRYLNNYANENKIVTIYWDNGYTGEFGFALFNRTSDTVTQSGQALISAILG